MAEEKKKEVVEEVKEDEDKDLVLFKEVEINGIKIVPWSFGKLSKVSVHLENILDLLDAKEVSIDSILSGGVSVDMITKLFVTLAASSELFEIISITVDKPVKEIEDLSIEDGVSMLYAIISQNWNLIKNVLAPLLSLPQEVEEIQETPKKEKNQK